MASACEDGHVVTRMKDLLTCPICLETLNDPRTLPCSHTFCKYCLGRFVKKQREGKSRPGSNIDDFNCPTCRKGFSLKPGEEVEDMTPNYLLCNMLEIMTATPGEMKSVSCAYCEQSSTFLCLTCELFMCEQCFDLHNKYPGFGKHEIVPVDELSKPQNRAIRVVATGLEAIRRRTCNKHDNSMITYFCETCKEMVCEHCKAIDHVTPKHSCQQIKPLARKQKEALISCCDMFNERLSEGEAALDKVSSGIRSIQNSAEEAKCEIDRRKRDIIQAFTRALEERSQVLHDKVDAVCNRQCSWLWEQKDEIKMYLGRVKGLANLPRILLNKSSDEEIISSMKAIHAFSLASIEYPAKINPELLENIRVKGKAVKQINFVDILSDFGYVKDFPDQKQEENLDMTEEPFEKCGDVSVKTVNPPEYIPMSFEESGIANSLLALECEETSAERIELMKKFVTNKIKQVQDDPGLLEEISIFMTNYLSSFIEVDDDIIVLSDLLFDKCVSEPNIHYIGAKLVNYLDKHLKPKGITLSFRQVFSNRCKYENSKVVDMISSSPDEVPNIAIFLGELFMNFKTVLDKPIVLSQDIISNIINEMLASANRKLHFYAGKLLKLTGSVLSGKENLEVLRRAENMAADPKTDRTARTLLNRVCELISRNWDRSSEVNSLFQPPLTVATSPPNNSLFLSNVSNCLEEHADELPAITEEEWNEYAIDEEDVDYEEVLLQELYGEICLGLYDVY